MKHSVATVKETQELKLKEDYIRCRENNKNVADLHDPKKYHLQARSFPTFHDHALDQSTIVMRNLKSSSRTVMQGKSLIKCSERKR